MRFSTLRKDRYPFGTCIKAIAGCGKRIVLHCKQYVVRVTSGRRYLSLVRPRERYQREGRPGVACAFAHTLCCLLDLGGCGTRTMRPRAPTCSNSPRRKPRGQSSCSARHRGPNCVNPDYVVQWLRLLRPVRLTSWSGRQIRQIKRLRIDDMYRQHRWYGPMSPVNN